MNSIVRDLRIDEGVSAYEFRDAMRHLVGGVSVITVGCGRDISGMTVTSLSSFSAEPATLIVSVNLKSSSWQLLRKYGAFGANILHADQIDVAKRFSGAGGIKGIDRFAGAEWIEGVSGTPLLVGALAALDCAVDDIVERHSHALVIGRVRDIKSAGRQAGLAYWQGSYVVLDQDEDAVKLAAVSLPTPRALWQT